MISKFPLILYCAVLIHIKNLKKLMIIQLQSAATVNINQSLKHLFIKFNCVRSKQKK